jgi:YVTN family beta-propeller protein
MRHAGPCLVQRLGGVALLCAVLLTAAGVGAQAPAAALLVLNKSEATLSIIDPATGRQLGKVPTGDGPHEIATSADGRTAFVTNYGSGAPGNTLSVIDIAGRKESRRVDLGMLRRPHGIALVNGQVIFTAEGSRSIARYDPAANKVDWQFETGQEVTHMVIGSRDGRTLFTTNIGSNSVSIIDVAGQPAKQTVVRVGGGPEGLDLSPDGRELWTAHSSDGGISVIDVASRKVVHTIDARTRRSNRLKFTRDGSLVLVSDLDAGEIVFLDARKRQVTRRLAVGRLAEGILIAPDGRRAFVAVSGENRVAVIDLQKLDVVQTIATGEGPDGMAWIN